jgi:hypothetical protein
MDGEGPVREGGVRWPGQLVVGALYRDRSTDDIVTYTREFHAAGGIQYIFHKLDWPTWNIPIWDVHLAGRVIAVSEMEALAWLAR